MNLISRDDKHIRVGLSRRNLETLIKCLDNRVGQPELHRIVTDDGMVLYVKAEENDEHYAAEARQSSVRGIKGVGPEDVPSIWEPRRKV